MKKIFLYICMICLAGLSTYAAINGTQANDDTFATNALKEGSFPLTFEQESTTAPWTTAGNGVVTSSNKEANSEVGFSTTFNLSFDATVSFDWSVNGDQLIFYVDNKQVTNISGIISNYTPYSYDLKTGVHTLKWSYKNSSSATTGDDRGYVKNIYMSPTSFIMPGVAYPVCETQLYFGNVVKNAPTTVNLNVRNIGSEQLNITKVTTDNTIFSIGDYEKNIPALETRTIPFTVTVTAEGLIEAKAIIVTNGGTREISLRANCTSDITSIAVTSPGNLSNQVSASDYAKINNLKLTGVINDTDIAFIKQNLTAVKTLDLLDASFINNSINTQFQKNTWVTLILPKGTLTINSAALQESEWLQSIVLPEGLTDINSNAFYKCSSLQNIVLPSTLRTIGIRAFNDCASLKAITIPDRVESIEQYVFYECSALEEIIIGNGVKSISGYGPFEGCNNLKKVVIGNGLTDLTGSIFQGKTNLTEVILGENITTIGSFCFNGCTGLEKIVLPKKLRNIEGGVFYECDNLRTIEMPDSLRILKDQVFQGCENLRSITLPDSLESIGNQVFRDCKALKSITIPSKVTSLGQYVFYGCSALESFILGDGIEEISTYDPFYECNNLRYVKLNDKLTYISNWFSNKSNLETVVLGNQVTTIGNSAFANCKSLQTINMPETLTTIGNSAFSGCSKLASIYIPESVNKIENYAFSNSGLRTFTLPQNITIIPNYVFNNCDSLRTITLTPQLTAIEEDAFNSCDSVKDITINNENETIIATAGKFASIQKVTFGDLVTAIPDNLFKDKKYLKEVKFGKELATIGANAFYNTGLEKFTLPDQVTTIGEAAFKGNKQLTEFTLSKSINEIPTEAFAGCIKLDSIGFPASIRKVGSKAFDGCDSLRVIELNPELTEIGEYAFYNAGDKKLESITIPAKVKSIGSYAFASCDTLSNITLGEAVDSIATYAFQKCRCLKAITLPAKLRKLEHDVFNGTEIASLNIPDQVTDVTGVFNGLNSKLTSVTLGNGIKALPEGIFNSFSALQSVRIGTGVTKLPSNTFYYCKALTDVTIGANVTTLDAYSFGYCTALKQLSIPEKVTDIHENAFYGTALTDLALNMEEIKDYAFNNRTDLTQITIGKNVKRIGVQAFGYTNITNITLPENLTTIAEKAFYGTKLQNIRIPASVKTVGSQAFYNCKELQSVEIAAGSVSIGKQAFQASPKLTTVIMKEGGEKNIATEAFYNCPALEQVTLASTDSIGTRAFSNCPKLASIHIPAKTIGAYAFANCSTLTDVTFAEGMDSIADYAFVNSTNINRVALPNSLRTIGAYAFSAENKENSLRSISFGNNLETIGKNAFYKSTQVKDIVIPDKVKTIRLNAFSNCENLRTVSVGSGVVTVEPFAFNANPNLMSITWNSKTRIENDAFNSYAKNCLMYVTAQTEVPQKWYNVIRDGVAENIEIADKYPFHCWKAFEAKKAIFRKTFSLETGRGNVSKGWESITLPFDVSRIWFESKSTELLPFGAEGASTRRFWLRELGENGFQSCQQIKAHTPYIIAMPNNREYDEQYNITGEVQFIAEDYRIPVTPEVLPIVEGPKFNFVPTLTAVEQSQEVYALNIDPYNTEETTGSVFERYRRDVKPFEAYVTDKPGSLNAPLMFSIGDNGGGATDIRITLGETIDNVKAYSRNGILYIESDCTRTIEIYGVNGMLLRNAEVNEGINQVTDLDEGVYFLEGQKVIVKQ